LTGGERTKKQQDGFRVLGVHLMEIWVLSFLDKNTNSNFYKKGRIHSTEDIYNEFVPNKELNFKFRIEGQ